MIQSLYIGVISYTAYLDDFQKPFRHYIFEDFTPPSGKTLKHYEDVTDHVLYQILQNLIDKNGPEPFVQVNTELFFCKLDFETDEELRFKHLPWLEEGLKDFITAGYHEIVGAYYFYLIEEDGKLYFSMLNKIKTEDINLEDDDSDDISYLQSMAEYLKNYFYLEGEDLFPDVTAKLLLKFGGD